MAEGGPRRDWAKVLAIIAGVVAVLAMLGGALLIAAALLLAA